MMLPASLGRVVSVFRDEIKKQLFKFVEETTAERAGGPLRPGSMLRIRIIYVSEGRVGWLGSTSYSYVPRLRRLRWIKSTQSESGKDLAKIKPAKWGYSITPHFSGTQVFDLAIFD
jgi:hypothetical protein